MPGRYASLTLSRNEQFTPRPLLPRMFGLNVWPAGTATTVFYDTAGGVIATASGVVAPDRITFDVAPAVVAPVPAGAPFETFFTETATGKVSQVEYGQVVRHEAFFPTSPAVDTSVPALQFRDDFYNRTGAVGSKWVVMPATGTPTIFDNSDDGDPNGVGPNIAFFTNAAMRYYAPLNSDSWLMSFNLLNPGPGKTGIVGASNATMTSYIFVMFESGTSNNFLHMGRGSGPVTLADQVSTVAHTVADNANYKLRYDDLTKKLELLNSAMTTTLISWTDSGGAVPKGPGYRYFGANWQASLLSTGVQLTSITAQDGL